MQGLVWLLIVSIIVWNGVARQYNSIEKASVSLILLGILLHSQSLGGLWASTTFAEKPAFCRAF